MADRPHHRPMTPGDAFFAEIDGGADPAQLREAADLAATLLVRGVRDAEDPAMAERVVRLADSEGLETLAEVWAGAPSDTLAGALWRLYALRAWVHREPAHVARLFESGRSRHQVATVLAGVADPPGPDELRTMVDDVMRGIARGDFAVTLLRAGAFARILAAGRAADGASSDDEVVRLLTLAEQLEAAGHLELRDALA